MALFCHFWNLTAPGHLYFIQKSSINILLNFSFCVLQKIESQMGLEWHELTMTEFYF